MRNAGTPITLIVIGILGVVWYLGWVPDFDAITSIALIAGGIAILAMDGVTKHSVVLGPTLIAVGVAWRLHDHYRFRWTLLVSVLLIVIGGLMLLARSPENSGEAANNGLRLSQPQAARRSAIPVCAVRRGVVEVVARQPAQREHRQRRVCHRCGESVPSECDCARVCGRRPHGSEQREVERKRTGLRDLVPGVTRRGALRPSAGRVVAAASLAAVQCTPSRPQARIRLVSVQQHLCAERACKRTECLTERALPVSPASPSHEAGSAGDRPRAPPVRAPERRLHPCRPPL